MAPLKPVEMHSQEITIKPCAHRKHSLHWESKTILWRHKYHNPAFDMGSSFRSPVLWCSLAGACPECAWGSVCSLILPTCFFPSLRLYAHICIIHSGHKTYSILNWTEVSNALKEFMLHNCMGLPENKRWCMAKILSQGDDSDPSLWLRPCWAADGAACNLCSRCRTRECKQRSNAWSKGHEIRNQELFGAFGDTQCFHLF